MDTAGKDKDRDDSSSEGDGRSAEQLRMLEYMRLRRGPAQRQLQVEPDQTPSTTPSVPQTPSRPGARPRGDFLASRERRQQRDLPQQEAQIKPLLEKAELLVNDPTLAPELREDYAVKSRKFMAGKASGDVPTRRLFLERKNSAGRLANSKLAAQQQAAQRAGQCEVFDDLAPTLASVKKSSFPLGQAANIEELPQREKELTGRDVALSPQFETYRLQLQELEDHKREAADAKTLKGDCQALIAAADAYLLHFGKDLNDTQQADSTRQHEKRYCEEGKLSAMQYLIALDFDAIPDPKKSAGGWSEKEQILAASVRAKMLYHEAYQDAITLGDGGDAAGASESRWLRGADWDAVAKAKPGALLSGADPVLDMPVDKRVAIFKTAIGEKAPDGMEDDQPGAGAIKEALACANAKLFARQTGIDLGVPETHVVSLNRYAIKGGGPTEQGRASGGPGEEVVGSSQNNAGAKDQIGELQRSVLKAVKTEDVHKMALLDIMSLNCDRHAGNIMVKFDEQQKPSLVPIDHGGSMPSRRNFDKVAGRIGGIDSLAGTDQEGNKIMVVNELLTLPSAYEPFDEQMLGQLDLLRPDAMVEGMKRHRDAVDEVHAGLQAKDKVPDERFEMSRRSMMFMKLAAKARMSPAEIQIALGQRGGELFDVANEDFETLANEVIEHFIPLKEGYKDLYTAPRDQVSALAMWLAKAGWTLPDGATGKPSAERFLQAHPVKAWRLFHTNTPNKSPIQVEAVPEPKVPKDEDLPALDEAAKQEVIRAFPTMKAEAEPKIWARRLHYWAELKKLGGEARYLEILRALKQQGVTPDDNPVRALKAVQLWNELQQGDRRQALKTLPAAQGAVASEYLTGVVGADNKKRADRALADHLESVDLAIDEDEVLIASIKTILGDVDRWLSGSRPLPGVKAFLSQVTAVHQLLDRKTLSAALDAAKALHGDVYGELLDAVADEGRAKVQGFQQQISNGSLIKHADGALGKVIDACYNAKSLYLGEKTLKQLDRLDELLQVEPLIAQAQQAAAGLAGRIKSKDLLVLLEKRLQYLIDFGTIAVPTLKEARLGLDRLEAVADIERLWGEVEEAAYQLKRGLAATMQKDIDVALALVRAELLVNGSMTEGKKAFEAMKALGDSVRQEATQMPQFTWEHTSDAKKVAIKGGFIANKDTGLSTAVEKPLKTKKEFLAALGKGTWKDAGEKAIKAHEDFVLFADTTLRSLQSADAPSRAWQAYCDSAVTASSQAISEIKLEMARQALG
ncbi:MAG: hypothetical protein IV097_09620 [Burkholderiaceae bacterium]|nr:hypothetical protein [Burkholderiaceae bacterium]